jgi:hypothetical protein
MIWCYDGVDDGSDDGDYDDADNQMIMVVIKMVVVTSSWLW